MRRYTAYVNFAFPSVVRVNFEAETDTEAIKKAKSLGKSKLKMNRLAHGASMHIHKQSYGAALCSVDEISASDKRTRTAFEGNYKYQISDAAAPEPVEWKPLEARQLVSDLWWFIENIWCGEHREQFFQLRNQVRHLNLPDPSITF